MNNFKNYAWTLIIWFVQLIPLELSLKMVVLIIIFVIDVSYDNICLVFFRLKKNVQCMN